MVKILFFCFVNINCFTIINIKIILFLNIFFFSIIDSIGIKNIIIFLV
jgi:hypothetical protein